MLVRSLLVLLCVNAAYAEEKLSPTAYAGPNGELGPGGLLYRDDLYEGRGDRSQDRSLLAGGLGQLSDGQTGCGDDPAVDCGRGPGFDWVGWRDDPTIVFQFGQRCRFTSVRIFTANQPATGPRVWDSVTVSLSEDGLNFHDFVVRTTTAAERKDLKARYIDIPLRGVGQFVRIHLQRAGSDGWLLISDVRFEGSIAQHQVSPSP